MFFTMPFLHGYDRHSVKTKKLRHKCIKVCNILCKGLLILIQIIPYHFKFISLAQFFIPLSQSSYPYQNLSNYITYSKLIDSSSKLPCFIISQTILEYLIVTGSFEYKTSELLKSIFVRYIKS